MSDVTLSSAVRSNLLSLQSTADLMSKTQERLATGKEVNSALDNPTNFFTASALNGRASDLASLLDGVSNATQTLEAADNGLSAITKLVESAQATVRQAQQTSATVEETGAATPEALATVDSGDTSSVTIAAATSASITAGTFSGPVDFTNAGSNDGSISFTLNVDGVDQSIAISYADVTAQVGGGNENAVTAADLAELINDDAGAAVASVNGDGDLEFTSTTAGTGSNLTISAFSATNGATGSGVANATQVTGSAGTAGDVTVNGQTVSLADGDDAAAILGKFQAAAGASSGTDAFTVSDSSGTLTLTGTAGNDVVIGGDAPALGAVGLSAGTTDGTPAAAGPVTEVVNPERAEFISQYNEIVGQINELAEDAGFNGVNLLNGDDLSVTFNEDGSSSLDISGVSFDAAGLGLSELGTTAFDTDASIDTTLDSLDTAIGSLRSQASQFGSNLSIVETREDFTKSTINTLETGAANLTLADTNEEGANLLALQTRQSLSSTSLSLASQADQNVLRLL